MTEQAKLDLATLKHMLQNSLEQQHILRSRVRSMESQLAAALAILKDRERQAAEDYWALRWMDREH